MRHLLPNCTPPLIVVATVQIANSISLEATLSFLGLGLPVTETSLGMETEPRIPSAISGLETFSLSDSGPDENEDDKGDLLDADSFFNLPSGGDDDEDEQP